MNTEAKLAKLAELVPGGNPDVTLKVYDIATEQLPGYNLRRRHDEPFHRVWCLSVGPAGQPAYFWGHLPRQAIDKALDKLLPTWKALYGKKFDPTKPRKPRKPKGTPATPTTEAPTA